jgi:hypothetical protein
MEWTEVRILNLLGYWNDCSHVFLPLLLLLLLSISVVGHVHLLFQNQTKPFEKFKTNGGKEKKQAGQKHS